MLPLLPCLVALSLAASLEEDLRPDKKQDAWTTSSRFKRDLVELFPGSRAEAILELGAHLGHCTRVLSHLFGLVVAAEHSEAVLASNAERTKDMANVLHLRFHTVLDDWSLFSQSRFSAVFIDAAHDYASVKNDLEQALMLPHVQTIVMDDYGAERGVRTAVDEALAAGIVELQRYIGESPPWTFADRIVEYWEGVVLRPKRGPVADAAPTATKLEGSTWVIFPSGVFVSGFFQPHGIVNFGPIGAAESSYGPLAWRVPFPHELPDGVHSGDYLILRLEAEPGWRAEVRLNARRTAGVLMRDDGHELVMLRQDMMRTVGEKLLSFMH